MLNREKHRLIMFNILKDIFTSDMWKYFAFKWWTACYFLYSLDRFSTDLDFDLLEDIEWVDDFIESILKKYWTIKKWNKLVLSYWEDDINIKIDINRKIWKSNTYEVVNFYWFDIKVQDKSTIFANKLVALLERNTNRDIYDVYFFFNNLFDINEEVIVERTWKNLKDLYIELDKKLVSFPTNYKILDWLWEVLTEKQKLFVKQSLVLDLIWIIQMKINFW
jgi:predicted nucleotidyltransferase component of viral defense system